MTRLTERQRTALARMSDGEWHLGFDVAASAPGLLGMLALKGLARYDSGDDIFVNRNWTITPAGMAALEASE